MLDQNVLSAVGCEVGGRDETDVLAYFFRVARSFVTLVSYKGP